MSNKFIFLLVLAGFVLLFIVQNVAMVEVHFMFWSIQLSRALLMFLMLSVGIIIGWLLYSYLAHHKARR